MYITRKLGKSLQILELFPNFAKKIMSHERKAKIYNSLYRGSKTATTETETEPASAPVTEASAPDAPSPQNQ